MVLLLEVGWLGLVLGLGLSVLQELAPEPALYLLLPSASPPESESPALPEAPLSF